MSPVSVFSLKQNKARKLALSTMGFVWNINSNTMHMIRECYVYRDKCTVSQRKVTSDKKTAFQG
jgi:hypothetical protein